MKEDVRVRDRRQRAQHGHVLERHDRVARQPHGVAAQHGEGRHEERRHLREERAVRRRRAVLEPRVLHERAEGPEVRAGVDAMRSSSELFRGGVPWGAET